MRELQARLGADARTDGSIASPTSWDDLDQWASQQLCDRLVLTSRALSAARKSTNPDVDGQADCLDLLAGDYRAMLLGESGARERFLDAAGKLKVSVSPTGQATTDHRYKQHYRLHWGGRERILDVHLSGSSSRDTSRQLRIYFTWCEATRQVIVGSLPEHLPNSLTH